jgi:hypothetical protein
MAIKTSQEQLHQVPDIFCFSKEEETVQEICVAESSTRSAMFLTCVAKYQLATGISATGHQCLRIAVKKNIIL